MTKRLKQFTAQVIGGLAVLIFIALVLDVLWGVTTRYLLGQQASWSEELARFLLVWLAMLGAALAYIQNSHLGVDILTRSFDGSAKRLARMFSDALILLFAAGVMVYGGGALFLERWDSGQVMSAMAIRKAWFYLSVPVSGILIAIFALESVVESFSSKEPPASAASTPTKL